MRVPSLALVLVAGIALTGAPDSAWTDMAPKAPNPAIPTQSAAFEPPAKEAIPPGPYGDMVKLGRDVFRETEKYARPFVGNELRCSNCHLDAGRLAELVTDVGGMGGLSGVSGQEPPREYLPGAAAGLLSLQHER